MERPTESSPIDKGTYRSKVYAYLRERIIAGVLLPGEAITLRGLSKELGVSVAPVREALVQLESEQVILRRDNRDYRVNTVSRREFDEICRIRRMIEPYLGERACRRRPESAVEVAAGTLEAMREARGDPKRFVALNHDLHFGIYACADYPILLGIVSGLWARIGPYLTINLPSQNLGEDLELHAGMVDAFRRKDATAFNRDLLADIDFSYGYVAPMLDGQPTGDGT